MKLVLAILVVFESIWIAGLLIARSDAVAPSPKKTPKTSANYSRGPFVADTIQLSGDESIRIITIPNKYNQVLDAHCFLYVNRETQTSHFSCPEVTQSDLGDILRDKESPRP